MVVCYKKLFLILLVAVFVTVGVGCTAGFLEEKPEKLSDLSAEELFQFLEERGVVFPENAIPKNINLLVEEIENDPAYDPAMSWTVAVELIAAVREVVNEYYGITVEE